MDKEGINFNKETFLEYMASEFPSVYNNTHSREILENIVQFAIKEKDESKGQLVAFLLDMIPEVREDEIKMFYEVDPELPSEGGKKKRKKRENTGRELWINCGESFLYFMTEKDTLKDAMEEFLCRLDSIGINHDNFGWRQLELRAGNTDPDHYYRVVERCGPGHPGGWGKEAAAEKKRKRAR